MGLAETLTDSVLQVELDAGLLHDVVHGPVNQTVVTVGGEIKTLAKAIADMESLYLAHYLGPRGTAPDTDNQGNPLEAGDLYFDRVLGQMRVYTGTGWLTVGADLTPYLRADGSTGMTGPLTLPGNPTSANHAATKAYVDAGAGVADGEATPIKTRAITHRITGFARTPGAIGDESVFLAAGVGLVGIGRNGAGQLGIGSTRQARLGAAPVWSPPLPAGVGVAQAVHAGGTLLVLTTDGQVYSTGNNDSGQLGHGDTLARSVLTRIEALASVPVARIAASADRQSNGYVSAYAVAVSGALYAWGRNGNGQLGLGHTNAANAPVLVAGFIDVANVYPAALYCHLLRADGSVYATGYNVHGALGLNDTTQRTSFNAVTLPAPCVQVSGGGHRTSTSWGYQQRTAFLLNDGRVFACGFNTQNNLGDGSTTQRNAPVEIVGATNVAELISHTGHDGGWYARTTTGRLLAWGGNAQGQIGDGTTTVRTTPFDINTWAGDTGQDPPFVAAGIVRVAARDADFGYGGCVVLDATGALWATGDNSTDNALGLGSAVTTQTRFNRVPLPLLESGELIVDIRLCGYDRSYTLHALTSLGRVYCAGINTYGQAGADPTGNSPVAGLAWAQAL